MKTSKLVLRPFMPEAERVGSKLEPIENKREPYATLSYGGMTIQLDYTILRLLTLDTKSYIREKGLFQFGLDEILKEMMFNHDGVEKPDETIWFRDNPNKCSITHPWSPLCNEYDNYTSKIDGSRTMVWEKLPQEEKKDGAEKEIAARLDVCPRCGEDAARFNHPAYDGGSYVSCEKCHFSPQAETWAGTDAKAAVRWNSLDRKELTQSCQKK